jgi:small subunit ribosomal protein S4
MGQPKKPKKRYKTPTHPWRSDRIRDENEIAKEYGLKNKRELWRTHTLLRKYRNQARKLLAGTLEDQAKKEADEILRSLIRLGILSQSANLESILKIDEKAILERRLQTIVIRKSLAATPKQARQMIVHGHISVNGRKVTSPSFLVKKEEEEGISYAPNSPFKTSPVLISKKGEESQDRSENKPSPHEKEGGKMDEQMIEVEE